MKFVLLVSILKLFLCEVFCVGMLVRCSIEIMLLVCCLLSLV